MNAAEPIDDAVIVGPCAAGKTTLARGLRAHGLRVRAIAQEHSGVPGLWHQRAAHQLIYLDVDLEHVQQRGRSAFPDWLLQQQRERLRDARAAASFYLDTSSLTIEQVLEQVLAFFAAQHEHR